LPSQPIRLPCQLRKIVLWQKNDHHDVHNNVILLFCWENAIQSFALESSLILSTKLGPHGRHPRHPRHPRHKDSRSCGTQVINSVIFKTFHAIPSSSQTPSTWEFSPLLLAACSWKKTWQKLEHWLENRHVVVAFFVACYLV
jgi:hypothetical protein